ncbi:probable cytochrome P450 6a17 [Teleopsis dalmanni]|uniref:probable cytochrome P450 6a17 n=1 Tax=Teleopsis dalmanni TaxID=139649 RepID=UPI0018CF4866|nr:probable cytochrome P450 6a17 [Teleopsis dalmanni]
MVVLLLLAFGAVALVIIYFNYLLDYWRKRSIPHNTPTLFWGNMKQWMKGEKHISQLFSETYRQFKGTGPFAGFYFLFRRSAVILDLDLMKQILIKDFNNFNERGLFHNERDDPLTGNLFFMDGTNWRRLRNKLTPTFTSGKMKIMYNIVAEVGERLTHVIEEKIHDKRQVLEITDFLARFTADVIGTCAFGLECNSLQDGKAEFVRIGKSFLTKSRHNVLVDGLINSFPNMARRLHMRVINDEVHEFYMRVVRETIDYREKNNVKRNDFMDMLIEMKNNPNDDDCLSIEEVAAQAFVFFIAGFETSSTTMGFALYELAQHQDIQNKLRQEINEVITRHNGIFSYECMKDMHYLDQVISETLRMHPVVSQIVRKTLERYETDDPHYYLDKGTFILIPVTGIHYDPDIYPEPEIFKPERFTPEEIQNRHVCSWLPFGEGPRNCIGMRFGQMQVSIGLVNLLRNFKFTVAPETQIPYKLITKSFVMNAENGIYLNVEKIH